MKKLLFLFALIPLFSFSQLVTIKKDTPIATSVECWEKMNQAAIDKDKAYFNQLIKEYCVVLATKDIEVYLVEKKIWKGMAILRAPGKTTRLYVNNSAVTE